MAWIVLSRYVPSKRCCLAEIRLYSEIGDRLDLRIFLIIGMIGTGFFALLFEFRYWLRVHSFYYFFIIQIFVGLFQLIRSPSVFTVIENWFGKKK